MSFPGGLSGASESEAGRLVTGAEYRGEVSRGHSRRKAGEASEALNAERWSKHIGQAAKPRTEGPNGVPRGT